eukprot:Pgem_evm1s8109
MVHIYQADFKKKTYPYFQNLPALTQLVLIDTNRIHHTLEPKQFSNLPNLIQLHLAFYSISDIASSAFENIGFSFKYGNNTSFSKYRTWSYIFPQFHFNLANGTDIIRIKNEHFTNVTNFESGFKFSNILPHASVVEVTDSDMRTLEKATFSDLSSLTKLELMRNHIVSIDPNAFEGLVNLHTLDLRKNQFIKLPKGLFSSMPSNYTIKHIGKNGYVSSASNPTVFITPASSEAFSCNNNTCASGLACLKDNATNLLTGKFRCPCIDGWFGDSLNITGSPTNNCQNCSLAFV